ncbi:glycoside hydrolase family 88 protein [Carboxylicivirga sp. M1479]|uniref:glycoside hydrolase family 88 protein n=1 Tax=Carboxylicivirga sp. M1479 TaxID=2594476 RepID=UPI0011785CC3|nr:glycoside hydrolase family 88 protein [Carboxylicivirga sp. M1479]TRX66424.1 glucuronyl hydrolase [Carboxylicivirga sp. M1479]
MKHALSKLSITLLTAGLLMACQQPKQNWLDKAIDTAEQQLVLAAEKYTPEHNPRSVYPNGEVRLCHLQDWTVGFFPGTLWYAYELSGNESLKEQAANYTKALDSVKYIKHTHDLGFMLYCSYGNAYRITQNETYKDVLLHGAESLISRYNENVGCIRSWDFGTWQYPVIVDNMMNLEYLMWTANSTNNQLYANIATSHANKTMANHFRDDYSSYHVVSYDTVTGKAIEKQTHQGYSHESAWARGQAWGVYGYTMMYRFTKDPAYLEMAQNIAKFIMNLETMPADKVPYWDYNAINIPDAPRDASAAAVTACALLELSEYTNDGQKYFSYAEDVLKSLSSSDYLAEVGNNGLFVLRHSVGALPNNSEVNTPINYADYYYLEALLRYKSMIK